MPLIGPDSSAASEIIPGRLWLGGIRAALDETFLTKEKITVIFNCSKDIPFIQLPQEMTCYRVPVDDNLQDEEIDNMQKWSPEIVYKLLKEYHEDKNILIHCAAGMQRSAAACIMFLMTLWKQPQQPVFVFMRERRSIVFQPGMNFKKAIDWYEGWLFENIIQK
jgi:rhodanese-related sulfurtransferase